MTDQNEKLNQLLLKLDALAKKHDDFSREVEELRAEIVDLKTPEQPTSLTEAVLAQAVGAAPQPQAVVQPVVPVVDQVVPKLEQAQRPNQNTAPAGNRPPKGQTDLERFIGENLINKIGIAITVIGVAIGAQYSIENDLISPLTRIVLGYLFGLGLLGVGIKLKANYTNYSAVLVSGAMAIMYFITFAAYGFYNLIPQLGAFGLMLVFTVFTVIAAINYNRQVIAHIALVGAYAVPFLLSDGTGRMAVLFSYMAIINAGIVVISFKKYWKPLYYAAFALTWLIFTTWYFSDYQQSEHLALALVFVSVFFGLFYLTFLAYKLLQNEKYLADDVVLLLFNSFLFFGIGYSALIKHETGQHLWGVFTLFNAVVHFVVSVVIYQQKKADRNLHFLVAGLVLVFITIAIPVQLDGNWVTLLWAGEAALLFWIGRTKAVGVYEQIAYPLMVLAFGSMLHDWFTVYDTYEVGNPSTRITPLINVNFLSSALFIAAFAFINVINRDARYAPAIGSRWGLANVMAQLMPLLLLVTVYLALRIEIATYFDQLYADSALTITAEGEYMGSYYNEDLRSFKSLWIINFSLLFVSILALANQRKFRSYQMGQVSFMLIAIAVLLFLTDGFYNLSEVRERYIDQTLAQYYQRSQMSLGLRYISLSFVAVALWAARTQVKDELTPKGLRPVFDLALHTTLLWIASSELINWMELNRSEQSYKLGLSILWGGYSLFLISYGIWRNKKPIRVGAIALFGLTLVKLFFYDISHLNTIAKTIVFVSLGILLLIISFLYNKFKHQITDHETGE